ncbi:MAG: RNA polymerase sigma factor [Lacibacter sp.]
MKKKETESDPNTEIGVLIKQSIAGNDQSFKILYDRIAGKMYSLCLRYIKNQEDANDVFQDGCTRLYANLKNYRADGVFEGWVRRIFVTTCLDHLKKKELQLVEIDEQTPVKSSELSIVSRLDLSDLFYKIKQLPDGQRVIFNLYMVEGYSHKEIAAMLNISESGSKSQFHRAKLSLKHILSNEQDAN